MDTRSALPAGARLTFPDGSEYTVAGELARGGSGIVYDAFYTDTLGQPKRVRVKECFPFGCSAVRQPTGALTVPPGEEAVFSAAREKMVRAYRFGSRFFETDGLTNLTNEARNLYEANGTLYTVTSYAQVRELSYDLYPSVRDSVAVVKSTAEAILRLHREGYLYLDIKPANVLCLAGTCELVRLFDFDTVTPLEGLDRAEGSVSYTRGFAAPELVARDLRRVGRYTDVYGIGALMFYMLFDRVPDAFDSDPDAVYDFSASKAGKGTYPDELFFRLTEFFHRTLANYRADRLSDMETVTEYLGRIAALSDQTARFVVNSHVSQPELFIGREEECRRVTQWLTGEPGVYYVSGMGGIGKSTLVRACVSRVRRELDSLVWLNAKGTPEATLADDYALVIRGVTRDPAEAREDYFARKLTVLRELAEGRRCVLVLDNCEAGFAGGLAPLTDLGWIVILLSREPLCDEGEHALRLFPMAEEAQLLRLFSANLGRTLTESEEASARELISSVGGHTLMVELTARQIAQSCGTLTTEQAAALAKERGFSALAPETVGYTRDLVPVRETLRRALERLLDLGGLSPTRSALLKGLALFGPDGVGIDRFAALVGLSDREDLYRAIREGLAASENARLTMHPVVREALAARPWSADDLRTAERIMNGLDDSIADPVPDASSPAAQSRAEALRMAEDIIDSARKTSAFGESPAYRGLLYDAVKGVPEDHEAWIRKGAEELLASPDLEEGMFLETTRILLETLYREGDLDSARLRLKKARTVATRSADPETKGRYHYLEAGFCDELLQGAYEAETEEEKKLVRKLLAENDRAARWLSLASGEEAAILLGECLRFAATVLIRGKLATPRKIRGLLARVEKITEQCSLPNSLLARDTLLTRAWFYTYTEPDFEKAAAAVRGASDITRVLTDNELRRIEEDLVPAASLYLEWNRFDEAEAALIAALRICEERCHLEPYRVARLDLLHYLLDVYGVAGKTEEAAKLREENPEAE